MDSAWQNLSDAVFAHAERQPNVAALIEGPTTLTYGALASLVGKASVHLHDLGIGDGMRIGIALTNSVDHVILLLALMRVGAVTVELSPDDSGAALAAAARQYGMRAIFTEAHIAPTPGVERIRVDRGWRDRIAAKSGDHRSAASGDALHILMLTTGSTGLPRAWIATHEAQARSAIRRVRFGGPGDWGEAGMPRNFLQTGSLRYSWFFGRLVVQLLWGVTTILLPEFANGPDLLRAIASWSDASAYVTAGACRYFISVAPETGLLLPNLRWLEAAGLPLHGDEKRAMLARVTPYFNESYGSTGSGLITILSARDMLAKAGSVGRPVPGVAVEVVDAAGNPLPEGMVGEIRSRPLWALRRDGDGENPGRGFERIAGGWSYPGDFGYFDAEGFLYLKGRGTEIIRRGAGEVFAADVEAVLAGHPAVAEVAVVGRPRSGAADEIVAFVVRHGALEHETLAEFCRARLAADCLPDLIYYAGALPRIGNKLDRVQLLKTALTEAGQRVARQNAG